MTEPYLKSLLADHETVLLITRQHGFVFFRSILFELVFAAVIIAVVTVIWSVTAFALPIWLGYLLIIVPVASLIRDYLIWKNKQYIITNRRVVQISGVFNKNVTDSSLEKVNDVKMSQPFWGRIFNFGDIEILTASELGVNLFKTIGDPVRFKTTMLNAKEGMGMDQDHYYAHSKAAGAGDIPALIEELDDLRQRGVLSEDEFQRKKNELLAKL